MTLLLIFLPRICNLFTLWKSQALDEWWKCWIQSILYRRKSIFPTLRLLVSTMSWKRVLSNQLFKVLTTSQQLLTCGPALPNTCTWVSLCISLQMIGSWDLFCLDTVPIFEDHTGQNLAETVLDILGNWELQSEQLVCTTPDNGSNFIAAFETLEWPRIGCFGHNLDLAVNKALNI